MPYSRKLRNSIRTFLWVAVLRPAQAHQGIAIKGNPFPGPQNLGLADDMSVAHLVHEALEST